MTVEKVTPLCTFVSFVVDELRISLRPEYSWIHP
jgi:hypothetical protein